MVGCRLLAAAPHRVASLTMLSTTLTGCNMATTMLRRPWITLRAGQGPLRSRIPANLRANFSPHYLAQRVGDKTRKQLLTESTWEAIRLGLTEKFLAEAQPAVGKNGHVLAVLTHRLSKAEVAAMRAAHVPLQMINGRHDVVAGLGHVQRLARALACPLVLTEGAHAGICLETPGPINAAMERIIGVAPPSLVGVLLLCGGPFFLGSAVTDSSVCLRRGCGALLLLCPMACKEACERERVWPDN
jgi:pimeloyl-ACP methyl ester carboxylesterase